MTRFTYNRADPNTSGPNHLDMKRAVWRIRNSEGLYLHMCTHTWVDGVFYAWRGNRDQMLALKAILEDRGEAPCPIHTDDITAVRPAPVNDLEQL